MACNGCFEVLYDIIQCEIHGRRKDYFHGEPQGDFSINFLGGSKGGEICFFPLETNKTKLFCGNLKNPVGGQSPPCSHFFRSP